MTSSYLAAAPAESFSPPTAQDLRSLAGKWYIIYTDFDMWLKKPSCCDGKGSPIVPNTSKFMPTFNYTPMSTTEEKKKDEKKSSPPPDKLLDVVMYFTKPPASTAAAQDGSITGYDTPLNNNDAAKKKKKGTQPLPPAFNTSFAWNIKAFWPISSMIESRWRIVYVKYHNAPTTLNKNGDDAPPAVIEPHEDDWAVVAFEATIFTKAGYDIISRNQKKFLSRKLLAGAPSSKDDAAATRQQPIVKSMEAYQKEFGLSLINLYDHALECNAPYLTE